MERKRSQPTDTGKLFFQSRKTVVQERFALKEFRRTPSRVKTEGSFRVYFCRNSKDIEKAFTNGGRFCVDLQLKWWKIRMSSYSATKGLFLIRSRTKRREGQRICISWLTLKNWDTGIIYLWGYRMNFYLSCRWILFVLTEYIYWWLCLDGCKNLNMVEEYRL